MSPGPCPRYWSHTLLNIEAAPDRYGEKNFNDEDTDPDPGMDPATDLEPKEAANVSKEVMSAQDPKVALNITDPDHVLGPDPAREKVERSGEAEVVTVTILDLGHTVTAEPRVENDEVACEDTQEARVNSEVQQEVLEGSLEPEVECREIGGDRPQPLAE